MDDILRTYADIVNLLPPKCILVRRDGSSFVAYGENALRMAGILGLDYDYSDECPVIRTDASEIRAAAKRVIRSGKWMAVCEPPRGEMTRMKLEVSLVVSRPEDLDCL